jgi:hypothetical protein
MEKYVMVLEATSPCHPRSADEGATIAAVAECTALVGLHELGGVSAVRLWRRTLRTRGSAPARALHSAACCGDRSLLVRLDLRSQRRVSHPNQHTRQTFAEDAAQERDQGNPREDARYSYHWRVVWKQLHVKTSTDVMDEEIFGQCDISVCLLIV